MTTKPAPQPSTHDTTFLVDRRQVIMPDGRYMIFYTYPKLDEELQQSGVKRTDATAEKKD